MPIRAARPEPYRAPSLGAMLRATVVRCPDRIAQRVPGKEGFTDVLYTELWRLVGGWASVIEGLGLARGDRMVLLGENSAEWAQIDWACQCLGVVVVPIYPTLPPDQTAYIARDAGARVALCASEELARKLAGVEGLQTRIFRGVGSLAEEAGAATYDGARLDAAIDAVRPDDPATIVYTSGTTGEPKGAVLSHRAFVHVCVSAQTCIDIRDGEVFLSFLPLSHIFERVAGHCLAVSVGGTTAYNKSLMSLAGEMLTVRPTLLMCVPRFLESFRDRVLDGVAKSPPMRRRLFALALDQGTKRAKGGFAPLFPLTDRLVGEKIRARTGDRFRAFVSGGAALAPAVAEFFLAFRLTVLQGYGLTETAGGTCVNSFVDNRYWTVGAPLDMELRIAEDGEILFRGPGLFSGYWNLSEATAAAIDVEGWFHTGDIGEMEGANLKITDRKKDLLVLGNGKNVAPQPIENKLRFSPLIQEAVVLGDGMESCVALIVPNAEAVREELGLAEGAVLSTNPDVERLVKREVDAVNKTLAHFELVKRFALLDAPFTVEGGELTPTLKVKRRVVRERYADVLDGLRR